MKFIFSRFCGPLLNFPSNSLRLQIEFDEMDTYLNFFQAISIINIGIRRKQFMDIKKGEPLPLPQVSAIIIYIPFAVKTTTIVLSMILISCVMFQFLI